MASKTETGEKVNNEYGHQFKMLMPNVEGACIHCGVRIAMYSETIGWDGSDNFRVWLFADGTWRKFGTRSGKRKDGTINERESGIPKCTVTRVVDPARSEQARIQFARGKSAGIASGEALSGAGEV